MVAAETQYRYSISTVWLIDAQVDARSVNSLHRCYTVPLPVLRTMMTHSLISCLTPAAAARCVDFSYTHGHAAE